MFFEDIENSDQLERIASRVQGLELNQVRKLIKMYQEAKKKLSVQLLGSNSNSFTEARLKETLEQIEITLRALNAQLKPQLAFSFDLMREQGIEDSVKEVNIFEKQYNGISNPIPLDAIIESSEPDNFLFNQFESSMVNYSGNLRNEFQRVLGQSLIQNKTWSQAVFDMSQVFQAQEYVLARIVRTELHGIYGASKLKGFHGIQNAYLPDLKKTLYHPIDSRTGNDSLTAAQLKLVVDLDKPFVYTFKQGNKTVRREFMAPPDRPHDRSILIPYRESYDRS